MIPNPLQQIFIAHSDWSHYQATKFMLELGYCHQLMQKQPNSPNIIQQSKQNAEKKMQDLLGEDSSVAMEKALQFYLDKIKST
jgi:hypothetical protein